MFHPIRTRHGWRKHIFLIFLVNIEYNIKLKPVRQLHHNKTKSSRIQNRRFARCRAVRWCVFHPGCVNESLISFGSQSTCQTHIFHGNAYCQTTTDTVGIFALCVSLSHSLLPSDPQTLYYQILFTRLAVPHRDNARLPVSCTWWEL